MPMSNESLLRAPVDPMLVKWLEEREARCTAEATSNMAWRNLEAAQHAVEIWRWRFYGAAATGGLAVAAVLWMLARQ